MQTLYHTFNYLGICILTIMAERGDGDGICVFHGCALERSKGDIYNRLDRVVSL